MVISLERDADCLHMVQLMPLHSQTPSSFAFASFKSILVLPFCYRLTQVVLEKRSLNGCSSLSVVCAAGSMYLSGVHLSVRLSVCSSFRRTPLRRVCCCALGGQEISTDYCARWLVAWHSGRTSVSGRRTFPVLRSTCS